MAITSLSRARLTKAVDTAVESLMRECPAWEWGQHDCATWAADIFVAAGLPDPIAHFRGKYGNAHEAMKALDNRGMLGAVTLAAQRFQWRELEKSEDRFPEARPGDIGLVQTVFEDSAKATVRIFFIAVRASTGDWITPTDEGAAVNPDKMIARAWSVLP